MHTPTDRGRFPRWMVLAVMAALLSPAIGADRPVLAQGGSGVRAEAAASGNYRELAVDQRQKGSLYKVGEILRDGQFKPGEQKLFDAYYKLYALARWSRVENRDQLTKFRNDLSRDLKRPSKTNQVHDYLNALALSYMENLAKPYPPGQCFHPAVRINAMLMIGELNQIEPTPSVPPKPWSTALPVLLRTLNDSQQLDAVKVAALVGVLRHAELGAIESNDAVKAVVAAMVEVLNAESDAAGSAVGHAWMKARAANVLEFLGNPGDKAQAVAALAVVVADKSVPLSTRGAAAEALGALDYRQAGQIDVAPMTTALTGFAQEAIARESRKPRVSRRRLKQHLHAALKGMTALAAADPKHQPAAAANSALSTMVEVIGNDRMSDADMLGQLSQAMAGLRPAAADDSDPTPPDVPPTG